MSQHATAYRSPTEQVRRTLFRILAGLRLVVLVYAVAVNAGRTAEMARPGLAWGALALLTGWTLLAAAIHVSRPRVTRWFYIADVAIACGALLLTLATHSEAMLQRGASSLPTLWVMGSVLAVALGLGWWQGVLAALCVSVVDVSVRVDPTANTWANIFLLVVAAAAVGFMGSTLAQSAEARAAADRLQAALEERARLARAVHDGVLQVLAMVQRRAREEPALADLGRLAAEQESSLRSLVQYDARGPAAQGVTGDEGRTDLVRALEPVVGPRPLIGPGGAVMVPADVVAELCAAVSECLLNVDRHVGAEAPAWVLVEELDEEVVVTVRDEGPGIAADRLTEAAAEGRMGVSGSILGRLRALGGRAELTSAAPIGTEWELHVPRTETTGKGRL